MINENTEERDEMEMLLPWYAAGTLGTAETARVEAWLAAHPEAQKAVALIREELDETIAANEHLGVPNPGAREKLMQAIAAEPDPAASVTGIWRRVTALVAGLAPAGMSPGMALAGAAAGLVILLQSAALGMLLLGAQVGGMRLASGEDGGAAAGTFVIVRFADDAKASDIAALLRPMRATIVDGPKPGAVFKIRVGPRVLTNAERTAIMDKLRSRRDIVSFIASGG